ncbi:MAG: hypothetical protein H0X02_06885 [Nitrosomonas sp.]|nr:hypothetical protein [Nitrosomonas sp.]
MQRVWRLNTVLLFILLWLCVTVETYSASLGESKELKELHGSYFDVCQHDLATYSSLRAKIDKRYPAGSDASSLIATIKLALGNAVSEKKVTDFFLTENPDEPTKNSWLYSFNKKCNYSSAYSIEWNVLVLTDLAKKIITLNIRPIIQTNDFSLIPAPFCFEYFTNNEETQKALWSLTGTGASKNRILALMAEICSEYGEIENLKIDNAQRRLGYRYRYIKSALIASRILPWEFSSIVIWEFDEKDKLIHLTVR